MDNICVGDRNGLNTFKRTGRYNKTQELKHKDGLFLSRKNALFPLYYYQAICCDYL